MASFLMLGLVQMAAATSRGLKLIESLSESQQGGRFAIDQMRDVVMAAGFDPEPWARETALPGLAEGSADGSASGSDVLAIRQLSDRNCYGNLNPVSDESGRPDFFMRESTFEHSTSGNLAHSCDFGPEGGTLVRQINRQGLVRGLESFQVLYVEDSDGDRRADRRVRAGQWGAPEQVLGVQIGLLLATEDPVGPEAPAAFTVLDQAVAPPEDGYLRRVWTTTIPFGSKLR
jgi:hypothetical protein